MITFIPIFVWVPPKPDSGRGFGVQVVYLGGGPGKHDNVERSGKEGSKAHKRGVMEGLAATGNASQ